MEGAGVQQGRASRMWACYKRARRVRITQELTSGWRVLHLQRRAGSRPQIIAHASTWKRAEKTEERKRGADSRKEADLFLTDLLTLWLPPARNTLPAQPRCEQTPGASFAPRSRPYRRRREAGTREKDVVTLKAFTFGLIATVCSDC